MAQAVSTHRILSHILQYPRPSRLHDPDRSYVSRLQNELSAACAYLTSQHPSIDQKVGSLIHRALMRSQGAGELDTHCLGTGAIDFEQWSRPGCASGPLQCASAHRSNLSRGINQPFARVNHSGTIDEDRSVVSPIVWVCLPTQGVGWYMIGIPLHLSRTP